MIVQGRRHVPVDLGRVGPRQGHPRPHHARPRPSDHPGFDFDANKGYPCPRHKLALRGFGPTTIHRMSWAFVDDIPWKTSARDVAIARALARASIDPNQPSLFEPDPSPVCTRTRVDSG